VSPAGRWHSSRSLLQAGWCGRVLGEFQEGLGEAGALHFKVMQAAVLGSDEAWNAAGRDAATWVDLMYRVTLGRASGSAEREYWAARLASSGRYQVAFGIAGSYEAATVRLRGYYQLLLGRDPDSGASVWVSSLLLAGNGDVFVPAAVAGSVEFSARAALRFP